MSGQDRRGEIAALLGGLLAFAAAFVLWVLGIWSESSTAWAAGFHAFGLVGIWFVTWLQLHQLRLVAQERMEVAELERLRQEKLGGAKTIFDEEDLEQMDKLAMGRRLRSIERVLVPIVALGVAAYYVLAGIAILPWGWQPEFLRIALQEPSILHEQVVLFFGVGIAICAFMYSRYTLGMSRLTDWRLLRAGANSLFGAAITCFALVIAMACIGLGFTGIEQITGQFIGYMMLVLAAEILINFILDFYRPRIPGRPHRPFYDSRILGMFSEPGGVLRSMADAIDYQFGFKVSETWFYQLMGQYIPWLLLVQAAILLGLSTLVVVPQGHQAVIERWGNPLGDTFPAGLHWTFPWPMDRAYVIPVDRVRRIVLGHEVTAEDAKQRRGKPILWTQAHFAKEYKLLVSDRTASANVTAPVNLLSMEMPVHWCVKPEPSEVLRFYTQSPDPQAIIESIAYRELTKYAAGADMLDLLGVGSRTAVTVLHENIQAACDRGGLNGEGLGVKIVHVGMEGVHPPPDEDVAKSYEKVVSAMEKRDAAKLGAQGDAFKTQVGAAGTDWQALYDAIVAEEDARAAGTEELPALTAKVEQMLRTVVGGEAREITAISELSTYARLFHEKSSADRYVGQVESFVSAPRTFKLRKYLQTLEQGLARVSKYIVASDEMERLVVILDAKPTTPLDILSAEVGALDAENAK